MSDNPKTPIRTAVSVIIRVYQTVVSPILPPSCRFEPSCSEYARQAILKYGMLRGTVRAIARLARCHPFHQGGYDPVR